jgi:hypothetical protein
MLEAGTFPSKWQPQVAQQCQAPFMTSASVHPATAGNSMSLDVPIYSMSNKQAIGTSSDLMPPPPAPARSSANTFEPLTSNHTHQPITPQATAFGVDPSIQPPHSSHAARETPNYLSHKPEPPQVVSVTKLVSRPAIIDTYTARSSTAPAVVAQHLSQILPPKRELPFEIVPPKPSPTTKSVEQQVAKEDNPGEDARSNTEQAIIIIPDSQPDQDSQPTKNAKTGGSESGISKKQAKPVVRKPAKAKPPTSRRKVQKCDTCK